MSRRTMRRRGGEKERKGGEGEEWGRKEKEEKVEENEYHIVGNFHRRKLCKLVEFCRDNFHG